VLVPAEGDRELGDPQQEAAQNSVSALSEHDRMIERLHDWGHWGRDDCGRPDPEAICATIYRMGKKDERELDEEAAPDVIRRLDVRDCEFLDVIIAGKIGRIHRNVVKDYFYKRRPVGRLVMDAAVRAVLDAEYVARELGWAA
jgi:hypothetical protein